MRTTSKRYPSPLATSANSRNWYVSLMRELKLTLAQRLNHNQLSVLPKEIWGLTRLTALLLNNNSLKAIPKDIKNLTKLKTLDLSSNQINEISPKDGLIHLTSLIELRLRNNLLPSIPTILADSMTHLQVLWLEGNPLPIPKSIIKKPASVILSYIKDHPNSMLARCSESLVTFIQSKSLTPSSHAHYGSPRPLLFPENLISPTERKTCT